MVPTSSLGKNHPFVQLTTDGKYIANTPWKHFTLNPKWRTDQIFYFLVQVREEGGAGEVIA